MSELINLILFPPLQELKEALANVQLYSRLDALLVKKKILNNGDSPDIHAQKVWLSSF